MYVDDLGQHCFILTDHQVFYNHWDSDTIFNIDLKSGEQ